MAYTWISFYQELAQKLLQFKNNRSQLVKWIKTDLYKVKGKGGHSLIYSLINNDDFKKQNDIDPFTVFEIINREYSRGEVAHRELLLMFHGYFNLSSDVPSDFEGRPLKKNFAGYFKNKGVTISFLWELFEKLHNDSISTDFDFLLSNGISINDLSISLYWIVPDKYIPLNDSNKKMLQMYEISSDVNTYDAYVSMMKQVQELQTFKSFFELTASAIKLDKTDRIWMWKGNENTFSTSILECGSDIENKTDFTACVSREDFRNKYQEIKGKLDYNKPAAYWDFINEAKEGEIVVVFDSNNAGSKGHLLYGWGRIVSKCECDDQNENPYRRIVEWHDPSLHNFQKESLTRNTRFFHSVDGIEAANIMKLLNIRIERTNEISNISVHHAQQALPSKLNNIGESNNLKEKYSKVDLLKDVYIDETTIDSIVRALYYKKNYWCPIKS
jgi:hypothetical protein